MKSDKLDTTNGPWGWTMSYVKINSNMAARAIFMAGGDQEDYEYFINKCANRMDVDLFISMCKHVNLQ